MTTDQSPTIDLLHKHRAHTADGTQVADDTPVAPVRPGGGDRRPGAGAPRETVQEPR